jgi:acyl-CoA thioesterase
MPRNLDDALGDGGMPLLAQLGVSFQRYGEGWAEAAWTPTPLASNPLGAVHGGVYGVVHDAAMNFAASSALDRGDRAATLDVAYQTMRSTETGAELSVRGEVVRLTRSVAYLESTVRDADQGLVSRATATFFVRRREA